MVGYATNCRTPMSCVTMMSRLSNINHTPHTVQVCIDAPGWLSECLVQADCKLQHQRCPNGSRAERALASC